MCVTELLRLLRCILTVLMVAMSIDGTIVEKGKYIVVSMRKRNVRGQGSLRD